MFKGGPWQWRKHWNNGEEEMTVKSRVKICTDLNRNVYLESSLVIVVGTVDRQVEQIVMMLESFASPILARFTSRQGALGQDSISCK